MKLRDTICNFGTKIAIHEVFDAVKNGKSVIVFCESRVKLKLSMDVIESRMNGNMLVNYSRSMISYKKGSVSFHAIPEIGNNISMFKNMRSDYYCTVGECFEN